MSPFIYGERALAARDFVRLSILDGSLLPFQS